MDLKTILGSDEFKHIHPKAKKILSKELHALTANSYLEPSDIASIEFLINDIDLYYTYRDDIKSKGSIFTNNKGVMVANPLLNQVTALQKAAIKLLTELGATTASRRKLNSKEMSAAEQAPIDDILNDTLDSPLDGGDTDKY